MKRIIIATAACLTVSVVAWAETAAVSTADVLRQAKNYQYQFRAGQYDVAPKYVAMLEAATKAEPGNADLSSAMGVAYLAQTVGVMLTGGRAADAWTGLQKGLKELEHTLELNPDQAEALAVHGGVQATMASMGKDMDKAAKGVAEMNRAVAVAPKSIAVRLARAFNGPNLPDALRNREAEGEDLDFLIKVAGGSRAGDYVRILRGDLYFESGKLDLSRGQYETASKSVWPAAEEAQGRLKALGQGGVAAADIKKLRSAAGANCVMCHGR